MAQRSAFTLRLGRGPDDAPIVVEFEHVAPSPTASGPRPTRLERVQPRWLVASAGVAIAGLVTLSVAAGTVSVAPPPAPTPLPGQPTSTPGPPALRVGNLVIQALVAARPTGVPKESVARAGAGTTPASAAEASMAEASPTEAIPAEADPAPADDGGGFRLQLPFFQPPPPRPTAGPRQATPPTQVTAAPAGDGPADAVLPVLPIASPAAEPLGGRAGPPRGGALEDALRTASIASDDFNRGLHEPLSNQNPP